MESPLQENASDVRSDIEALGAEILTRRESATRSRLTLSVRHVPRASDQGECAREMLLSIRHWDKRPMFTHHIGERLRRGTEIEERIVTPQLMELGFRVFGGQMSLEIRGPSGGVICTGHIDGRIEWRGKNRLFDVKSLNPNLFERVNSAVDLWNVKWMRKWLRQMLLYCHAFGEDGAFLLIDDCLGHWKVIPIIVEEWREELDRTLRRCEAVVVAKNSGAELPFHEDVRVCRECWAMEAGVCSPPIDFAGSGVRVVSDADIIEGMARLKEIEETGEEYAKLKDKIKEYFKARGAGEYIAGDTAVTVKKCSYTRYDVPADVKGQYKVVDPEGMTRVTW